MERKYMSVASRIIAERTRLIQNADEAFVKKLEGLLCKQKVQKQNYGGTNTIILLTIMLVVLFVLLTTLLSLAVTKEKIGSSAVVFPFSPSIQMLRFTAPTNNLPIPTNLVTTINNTIIQPVQEVIKERVIIGQQQPCLKLITERGVTYVCET